MVVFCDSNFSSKLTTNANVNGCARVLTNNRLLAIVIFKFVLPFLYLRKKKIETAVALALASVNIMFQL